MNINVKLGQSELNFILCLKINDLYMLKHYWFSTFLAYTVIASELHGKDIH